ncbi:putative Protein white [Corchorus olitorius]|uniref:Uncharacterized protein n=1 Tax=Corchorus olitorius TaxID=93759 RepID=A0A1R3FXW1_9ROSI|nr:putative Protein white [Corchorus olitorius]
MWLLAKFHFSTFSLLNSSDQQLDLENSQIIPARTHDCKAGCEGLFCHHEAMNVSGGVWLYSDMRAVSIEEMRRSPTNLTVNLLQVLGKSQRRKSR